MTSPETPWIAAATTEIITGINQAIATVLPPEVRAVFSRIPPGTFSTGISRIIAKHAPGEVLPPLPEDRPLTAADIYVKPPAIQPPAGPTLMERVQSFMADSKPLRYTDLAAKLGVEKDVLKTAIETPGSGYTIAAAGWVKAA
jgi:hypothetical protein